MSAFRPTRSSPPVKAPLDVSQSLSTASTSQAAPVPELSGLTPDDVELIDVIIARAGDTATTFLTVFKAYNDVLQERGLDPHEVMYYGKLLKLGTLKGRNWTDKWAMVKKQYSYGATKTCGTPVTQPPQPRPVRRPQPSHLPARELRTTTAKAKPVTRDDDSFTLHSHENDCPTDAPSFDEPTPRDNFIHPALARARARQRQPPAQSDVTSNSLGLDFGESASHAPGIRRAVARPVSEATETETVDNFRPPSTTPPSYRAVARDILLGRQPTEGKMRPSAVPPTIGPTAKPVKKVSVINDEEAWKNIRMAQYETEADEYYRLRLLERCWDVWKQGLYWIITTHEQIQEARENLLLRLYLQKWRERLARREQRLQIVVAALDQRRMKSAFSAWRKGLIAKQHANWRDAMRAKMKLVRQRREQRLRKDAWAKWRQAYKSHLSNQHFNERLALRTYKRWKEKLIAVDHLEDVADRFLEDDLARVAENCWNKWRRMAQLRVAERTIDERVSFKIKVRALDKWQKQMHDLYSAHEYYDLVLVRSTIRKWKTTLIAIRQLQKRADRHIARQDDVLLRAVTRVWKARERGLRLERIRSVRLAKRLWLVWLSRLEQQRRKEALATQFVAQSCYVLVASFQSWRRNFATHQNAQLEAIHHHSRQVKQTAWVLWLARLQQTRKMGKRARLTEMYFLLRRTWTKVKTVQHERVLEHKLKSFRRGTLNKVFNTWQQTAQRQRNLRLAEEHVSTRIRHRLLRSTLTHWTNRVIDIKLREIEVKQRYEVSLIMHSFTKWKHICIRHVEDLSLMESYREVKREDQVRRIFHQWLAATRASAHRRLLLKRLEDEKQLTLTMGAWERWREKFKEEQLRPLEYQFLFQVHNQTLQTAMGRWKSRTKSVPAIRFHAHQVKSKYWSLWRSQMPRIQLAKQAKEMDRKNTLSRYLDEWVQAYRTKLTRKAVELLRLPTATNTPRPGLASRAEAGAPAFRNMFHARRPIVTERRSEELREPSPSPLPRTIAHRSPLFPTRPRSETSPTRRLAPPTRDTSPARSTKSALGPRPRPRVSPTPPSIVGGDEEPTSGRLWQELREVRNRSKTPSERSTPLFRGRRPL